MRVTLQEEDLDHFQGIIQGGLFPLPNCPSMRMKELEILDNACKTPVPWEFISQAPELGSAQLAR